MVNPSISVILPTFNRAQFISQAIESALRQTHPPDEIIIIDDGSTDDTGKIVAGFGKKIKYVWQQNQGPAAARNHGMRLARGDFFAFLDSDDLWMPNKIKAQLAFFSQNPEVDFVFADMANFTGDEKSVSPEVKNIELHNYLIANATNLTDLFAWLVIENVVPTPTVMCKRSAALAVGDFNETLRIAEDLNYWLRASEKCRWGFTNDVLLLRRRHESNLIGDSNHRNEALLKVLNEAAKQPIAQTPRLQRLIANKINNICYDLGSALLYRRDFSGALHYLRMANPSGRVRLAWSAKLMAMQLAARLKLVEDKALTSIAH